MSKTTCEQYQANRKVADFTCDLKVGHTEPHRDPKTGIRWRPRKFRPIRSAKRLGK